MTASRTSKNITTLGFNDLRRGATYRATTRQGATIGEYLGMESPYGDRSLLLRHRTGTASIPVDDVTSIQPAAA